MSRLHVTNEWNDGLLAITNRCFSSSFSSSSSPLLYCLSVSLSLQHEYSSAIFSFFFSADALSIDPLHWRILFVASSEKEGKKCIHRMNTVASVAARTATAHYEAGSSTLCQLMEKRKERHGNIYRQTDTDTHTYTHTSKSDHDRHCLAP